MPEDPKKPQHDPPNPGTPAYFGWRRRGDVKKRRKRGFRRSARHRFASLRPKELDILAKRFAGDSEMLGRIDRARAKAKP